MVIAGHETVAAALTWTLMLLAEDQRGAGPRAGRAGGADPRRCRCSTTATRIPCDASGHRRGAAPVPAGVGDLAALGARRRGRRRRGAGRDARDHQPVAGAPPRRTVGRPGGFRPERFLDAGAGRTAYLPFGQGPRLCIGRELALGEMAVVLDRLLATHRVGLPTGWTRPAPEAQVAVHPRGGMHLRLTRSRAFP